MSTRLVRHVLLLAIVGSVLAASVAFSAPVAAPTWCPAGYHPAAADHRAAATSNALMRMAGRELDAATAHVLAGVCASDKHPEEYSDIAAAYKQMSERENAPYTSAPAAAVRRAIQQRMALASARANIPGAGGTWSPFGKGPLIANDSRYGNIDGEGFVNLAGRVDSIDYDPVARRLFASLGSGGVWASNDLGANWYSIGDSLPVQIIGAVAWTPASGGTLVAVSGEPIMAGYARTGYGAFYTRDLGATWHQSAGVPDDILGMQVAVDPTSPNVVYVATSKGLYRSADAGASFDNVRLPTGSCAGKTDNQKCLLANIVTDVVVQAPDKFGHKGGRVLAVVGYRAGNRAYPQNDTVIESAYNGMYRSDSGKPGTFSRLATTGFAPQDRIGKVEMGIANGAAQNHDYVYAIVEDAKVFNGGIPGIDAPEDTDPQALPQGAAPLLNGIYVTNDLGLTWTQMADWKDIGINPTTGSALVGTGQATLYAPGAQSWYNQWIKPDPSRATSDGIPTRLAFGLEEIWTNDNTTEAADGAESFHVIGRYFANRFCLFVDTGQTTCPTGKPMEALTTTHPDQHDGFWLPDGHGGVTLFAGNDGGVFKQHAASGEELDNTKWGSGSNNGFHTLLPYQAVMAKDGVTWFGLQDNGSGKVDKDGKYYETFGGDGFYVAVDPNNSDYAWSEVTGGNMRVTTDGGRTWKTSQPLQFQQYGAQFANPFVMDPLNANHLMTASTDIVETVDGANTCPLAVDTSAASQSVVCTWTKVYNLGSRAHHGDEVNANLDDGLFNLMSALDLRGDAAYVGYCGPCGLLNRKNETGTDIFTSGIATNVGGSEPAKATTSQGWHIAAAAGLPGRMITGVMIDAKNPSIVTVTLGGYEHREWRPPGSYGDKNDIIGKGHVFRSTDAGASFTDVSGDLPDAPALSLTQRGNQLIVGTKIGAFISDDLRGSHWAMLGDGLPAVQVMSLQIAPQDPNLLVAATFGRGVYTYRFPKGTSVLGARKTRPKTKPRNLPATGVGDSAGGALAVSLAAAMALALHRRRRTI